ncbi:MAG: DUF2834 domain-containing protein [Pseudomonadota bacterium]|nr:DUF2834 domain-containing protein [Pseudomonadota bacterium]
MNRTVLMLVLALVTLDFAVLSGYAILQHGYLGLFEYQLASPAGWQVLADLVIVATMAMVWMIADARRTGRTVWPYLLTTVFLGSFGPLAYLLIGMLAAPDRRPAYA